MIQHSAYVNLILDDGSVVRQIYLELNQNQKETDRNNNDTSSNICCDLHGDQHHDETTTTPEQEHFAKDSERNCSHVSRNVESKTDGGCITTTCTSQPNIAQPKDDNTQETVEILEQISGTGKLTNGSITIPAPAAVAAVDATKHNDADVCVKRPMNAFLMFCRGHRKIVKKHFVVENREISSILGKWWRYLAPCKKWPFQQLAKENRRKLKEIYPNYQYCKRVPARTPVSKCTNEASANTSLVAVATDRKNDPDENISDECLEAAETLVSLRKSFEMRPLTTFKLADESQMGSLRKLYTVTGTQHTGDRAVAVQPYELRCNQSSQVKAPWTSGLLLGGPPNQAGEGPSATRAARACKGKRYNDIISHILPRAQSKCPKKTFKKSQKTNVEKQPSAASDQPTITNAGTVDPIIKEHELEMQMEKKVAALPLISIDQFLSALEDEKKRKKPPTSPAASRAASPLNSKKRKTELSPAPNPQEEVPEVVVAVGDTIVNAPIGTTTQPASSGAVATEAQALEQPPSTKLVGSSKRKFPKERITHHPQSEMEERQTILICHKPEARDGGICHAGAGLLDNQMTFH